MDEPRPTADLAALDSARRHMVHAHTFCSQCVKHAADLDDIKAVLRSPAAEAALRWWSDGAMVNEGLPGDEGFVGDAANPADAQEIVGRHNESLAALRAAARPADGEEGLPGRSQRLSERATADLADEACAHRRIDVLSAIGADGFPGIWACHDCKLRFYPACRTCVDVGHRNIVHPAAARPADGEEELRAALTDLLGEVGFMRSCIASGEKLTPADLDRQNRTMAQATSLLAPKPGPDHRTCECGHFGSVHSAAIDGVLTDLGYPVEGVGPCRGSTDGGHKCPCKAFALAAKPSPEGASDE